MKRTIWVLISITISLVPLVTLLHYLRPPRVVRPIRGLSCHDDCASGPPRNSSQTVPSSFINYAVPDEIEGFTPHVWQTSGPQVLTAEQRNDIASWRAKHPFFNFTMMTDDQGDSFVREHFPHRPDIVDLFLQLPIPIFKADLFRYLVLVAKGGIYADIDVFCEQPISTWLPPEHLSSINSISLIIGLEFDFEFRGEGTEVASQFANWVIASKPGNKRLQHVVDSAVSGIYAIAKEHNVDIEKVELWMFPDVVNVAGPKRMTIAVLESLSEDLKRLVDDRMISSAKEPRLVGDVLIMPNNAFAAMQAGYPTDRGPVLVTHHYTGSWKEAADAAKAQKQSGRVAE